MDDARRGTPRLSPVTSLLDRILLRSELAYETGCWEFQGSRHSAGYGVINVKKKMHYAHRVTYSQLVGPIPAGLHLDHLCRNRICVRPDHLEAVEVQENVWGRGRHAGNDLPLKTHCKRSHEMTRENTYVRPDGAGRQCVQCIRLRTRGEH